MSDYHINRSKLLTRYLTDLVLYHRTFLLHMKGLGLSDFAFLFWVITDQFAILIKAKHSSSVRKDLQIDSGSETNRFSSRSRKTVSEAKLIILGKRETAVTVCRLLCQFVGSGCVFKFLPLRNASSWVSLMLTYTFLSGALHSWLKSDANIHVSQWSSPQLTKVHSYITHFLSADQEKVPERSATDKMTQVSVKADQRAMPNKRGNGKTFKVCGSLPQDRSICRCRCSSWGLAHRESEWWPPCSQLSLTHTGIPAATALFENPEP